MWAADRAAGDRPSAEGVHGLLAAAVAENSGKLHGGGVTDSHVIRAEPETLVAITAVADQLALRLLDRLAAELLVDAEGRPAVRRSVAERVLHALAPEVQA